MQTLRKFNEHGLNEFARFLKDSSSGQVANIPYNLLNHDLSSDQISDVEIESRSFKSRFEFAEYMYSKISSDTNTLYDIDPLFWSWLTLFFFDCCCPVDKKGQRFYGEEARLFLKSGSRRYYRHLLAGPYFIYKAHKDSPTDAMILLYGPINAPGDIVGQFASNQKIVSNPALLKSLSEIYLDKSTNLPKKGATSYNEHGGLPGTIRRLIKVWGQFDVNWDLDMMSEISANNKIQDLLPREEFKKFLS